MDLSGFQQKTIKIVVKTPNQAHGDQTIEGVDVNWTVKDLKTHLSAVYPNNPAQSDQRLIYSGKLLPDNLLIKDIFRQTDTTPTIHLVCAVRTPASGPLGARPKVRVQEQPEGQTSPSPRPQSSSPRPSVSPELRQRSRHAAQAPSPASSPLPGFDSSPSPTHTPEPWPAAGMPGAADMTPPAFPTYSLYSPQQLLWLQHVYARQYYMQYQAALAAAGSTPLAPTATIGPYPPVAAHQAPVAAALPNPNPIDNLPANQNAQDPAFINPGAANQNLRMNAQGGPVMEDEEDVNRDWLDWVYTASRLGVFLSIVYFYSSLSRFVLVMSSLLLMYLHTVGWFPFRRRPLVREPNAPNPQQLPEVLQNQQNQQNLDRNPDQAPGAVPAGDEGAGPEGAGLEGQAPPMTAVLVPAHRVSMVWTAWVFFKTFFSSLIPEAPQIAN
ncbi:homocysteine-responsive endoplasmic reticulum-resident ubiquitin-like domain member 1 protein [Aplochiton taeniatus]